jgi:hypothetical protein
MTSDIQYPLKIKSENEDINNLWKLYASNFTSSLPNKRRNITLKFEPVIESSISNIIVDMWNTIKLYYTQYESTYEDRLLFVIDQTELHEITHHLLTELLSICKICATLSKMSWEVENDIVMIPRIPPLFLNCFKISTDKYDYEYENPSPHLCEYCGEKVDIFSTTFLCCKPARTRELEKNIKAVDASLHKLSDPFYDDYINIITDSICNIKEAIVTLNTLHKVHDFCSEVYTYEDIPSIQTLIDTDWRYINAQIFA